MTTSLRQRIRALVSAVLPPNLPMFDDNELVRGGSQGRNSADGASRHGDSQRVDGADGAALERGYLRLGLALEDAPPGLGANLPRPGRLAITIAVPAGGGSAAADAVVDALNTGLSFGGTDAIRFGGLALSPGRQVGQHWVIDAEIGFAVWPDMADTKVEAG
jgi:hypothetical protein